MDVQPDLFTTGSAAPVDVAPRALDTAALADRLPSALHLGTSSWSFPGWAGLVYDRETDKGVLARHGLPAYARHPLLRTVGVDRSYYEALPERIYASWASVVPDGFRFVVKATRSLVTPGETAFLDASRARDEVVGPAAAGLGEKVGAVLMQFPPTSSHAVGGPRRFAERLYRFLEAVDSPVPIAVEIRTPGWLTDDYGAALQHGGATHGWVVHPRMAPLAEQRRIMGPPPPGPTVIRWMLAPGQRYESARDAWSPFDRLRAPDPTNRTAVAALALEAVSAGGPALVVVNNKAEGSSPASIEALARLVCETV
jgi:uncharacterized protein YecE (DUF72 family)